MTNDNYSFDRFLKPLLFVLIFTIYFIFLFHQVDLSTADLGRHLKNGEMILTTKKIPATNIYSYTEPDFPTLNHHWLSGVVFYLIYSFSGFVGLSVFSILVGLITLLLFVGSANQLIKFNHLDKEKLITTWPVISLACLLALPLLGWRTEIRPEMFSYLFSGIFFYLLIYISLFVPLITKNRKAFLVLPLLLLFLQLLWTNLHIYFFLGPFLVSIFTLAHLIKSRFSSWRFWFPFTALIYLTTLINPYGLKGSLAPLTIFSNYGYRLIENQSVLFIQKLIPNPIYPYFIVIALILILSGLISLCCPLINLVNQLTQSTKTKSPNTKYPISNNLFVTLSLSLTLSLLAFSSTRNLTLFGFFIISLIALNLSSIRIVRNILSKDLIKLSFTTLTALITLVALILTPQKYFPYWHNYGINLEKDNLSSLNFFKQNGLSGPIFNNYDIGSYLIYGLYPKQQVFVDNRPEAYSVDFFQKTYIPMQESNQTWNRVDSQYRFNTIFFAWHDATPWGQTFLKNRLEDNNWAPVYVDRYALILVRRNEVNKSIISQFEIPKSYFIFTSN